MHGSDISNKNFNPTFLFAVKYERTSNGYAHSHDYIELLYLFSGEGRYEIDGTVYDVHAGNLLLINPGIEHANIVTSREHPLVILALGFTDIHLKGMPENVMTFGSGTPVLEAGSGLQEQFTSLFFHMLAEKEQQYPGKYDMMRSYLSQILLHIIRSFTTVSDNKSRMTFVSHQKHHVVQTILDYMQIHYAEKISLDGIASDMYLSSIYISKLFKEETGESPIHYLIQIRLRKATELMKEHPEYSIKKIAHAVGYEDAYHFSKIFKKHLSVTPKEYRKNICT